MSSPNLTTLRQRAAMVLAATRASTAARPAALADAIGVSRQTVYQYETVGPPLDDAILQRVEVAYGLEPGALIGAMFVTGGASLDYWRGRVEEVQGHAVEVAGRLARLAADMGAGATPPSEAQLNAGAAASPPHAQPRTGT